MDKLRADFEDAWVADNSNTSEEADIRREALTKIWHTNESGEGAYFDSFVMWAWKWWQASRASIVVEPTHYVLKNEICGSWGCDEDLRCYTLELDAKKAKDDFGGEIIPVISIRSIGLSIKGE